MSKRDGREGVGKLRKWDNERVRGWAFVHFVKISISL